MGNIIEGREVVSTFDFNQFQPGESVDQCGPAAVSLCHFMGQPGKPTQGSPQDAIALMAELYTKFIGPDVPTDFNGTGNQTLYNMIAEVGNHYQNLYPDGGVNGKTTVNGKIQAALKDAIAQWVEIGYPVIVGVIEDSVYDMGLKKKPYSWNTAGLSHIITITGVSSSGIDFLVRDTANVLAPGPRMYASWQLNLLSATVIVPGRTLWLPRPSSVRASDMEVAPVTVVPKPIPVAPAPAPAPTPAPAPVDIAALQARLQELEAEREKIAKQLATIADELSQASPSEV